MVIPLLAFSTSNQEIIEDLSNELDRFEEVNRQSRHLFHSPLNRNQLYKNEHILLKKTADFQEILKPCNQIPASGRGNNYADCVRQRMLLLGRKRRQTSYE
ncbi:unnamed protein product [Rotaria magnacalcarata]|nr:unnamed protein product [Rotaria magnacalcarata]CAF1353840.1 unnamed protein product [Rotaria magnacalcarata]CAF2044105.1 unnamed protein product [Rotaria magnacalcarata]CAF2095716.1 unnamed protein product [Rotaria magnacalcarata]CAF3891134.1 unnamed protein product [Rotaria magnacalcarata]